VVALFPGHTGKDTGAVGKTASGIHYVESAVNIIIVHKISLLLGQIGVKNNTYMGTLEDRVKNSSGARIGISVHADFSRDKRVHGHHIIHYPKSLGGELLACMVDEAFEDYKMTKARKPHQRTDLFILKKTAFPVILVEAGFLSNDEDCVMLHSNESQWRIAHAIVNAIVKFNKTGIREL